MQKIRALLVRYPTVVLALLLIASVVWQYHQHFISTIDIQEHAAAYSQSQYVLGEKSLAKIDDSTLYTYASFAYWQGEDPTTINFEHPPLAKYYYGLFIMLFGNPFWGSVLVFLGVLLMLDKIAAAVGMSTKARLLLVLLVGTLSLLRVHTRYTLLDLPQLFGTLLIFLSAITIEKKPTIKYTILLGAGLAIVAGAKYWFPWLPLMLGFIGFEAVRTKQLKPYLVATAIGGGVYLLTYLAYFLNGHTVADFVAFEWFRFKWFSGKTDVPKFLVFQTLFTGQFQAWWAADTFEKTQHWSILWPVSFLSALWIGWKSVLQKNYWMVVLIGYSLLLLSIFAIGAAASDRFFIQLLPFWMLALAHQVDKLLLHSNETQNTP